MEFHSYISDGFCRAADPITRRGRHAASPTGRVTVRRRSSIRETDDDPRPSFPQHAASCSTPTRCRPSSAGWRSISPAASASCGPRSRSGSRRRLPTPASSPSNCCSRIATAGAAPNGCAGCRTTSSWCSTISSAKHLYPSQIAVRRRAHGDRGDRRLRPRPDGAGLRHRSAVPAALQADRLGRIRRRGDPLLPVGHGPQGRARDALGRRVHPPGQGRHDDPHRDPRGALPARRPQAVRRAGHALRQADRARHRAASSSPPSSPSARSAIAAPASRATWSSRTSRTARAACATCTRCSGSRNTSTACASPRS